jgi:hypothetical protein
VLGVTQPCRRTSHVMTSLLLQSHTSYLHVLNHPFALSRFQKSLEPSWFCVVAQHHVLQFPLSAKTCSIRTAGTSTDRCMISRLSCSVRSTGARSKSHEARVTQRQAVHRYAPQAATGLNLVATRSVRSGGRILTVVLPCATLEARREDSRRDAFPVPSCINGCFGDGKIRFSTVCAYVAVAGQAVLTPRQLQMTGVCATTLRKH